MYSDLRSFIEALGGTRTAAPRLGLGTVTLYGYIQAGRLPAKFYRACCQLAVTDAIDPPAQTLFDFKALPGADDGRGAAA